MYEVRSTTTFIRKIIIYGLLLLRGSAIMMVVILVVLSHLLLSLIILLLVKFPPSVRRGCLPSNQPASQVTNGKKRLLGCSYRKTHGWR